ncbi:hypothetical protein CF65_00758 [Aggregatibacter actinomycetemcomitans HK1651]|nr:hypothetical protein CF65_00758 [Aggregatibacter actinomycetemcomitans HK1651]
MSIVPYRKYAEKFCPDKKVRSKNTMNFDRTLREKLPREINRCNV